MSDEPWYFDAVATDRRSATDAMHELGFTAIAIGEALALLEADIALVVEDWEGGARRAFDEQMPGVLGAGHQLVAALTTAATAVTTAARERAPRAAAAPGPPGRAPGRRGGER